MSLCPGTMVGRSAQLHAESLIFQTAESSQYLENLGINSIMPKFTFQCVYLCVFIYLCSTWFQNLFEHDCFSESISNGPGPPLSKAKDVRRAGVPGRAFCETYFSEVKHLSSFGLQQTAHISAQVSPSGSRHDRVESVKEHPSWSVLGTAGFCTVKSSTLGGPDVEACSVPATEELWSLSALTDGAFRHAERFSGPVIRTAGETTLSPHGTGTETPYAFPFSPTSCCIQKPQLCLYADLFCVFFKERGYN